MKRAGLLLIIAIAFAGLGRAAYDTFSQSQAPLSKYVPAGPLLYLEAKDFSSLLSDWNASHEKRLWVDSSNHEVFSRSRLFLRLKDAGDQFAAAAGLPPDMDFLSHVAGTRSVFALYDIGNLQFLYITDLPSARSMQTKLWQARATFEPRSAGGVNFYLRRDPQSQKEVAFAVAGDYLLLATREDLMAGALQLIAGGKDRTVESEPWWSQSVSSAGAAGDLRMVLNLDRIVPSPYFRTYWVQQNITDMKQYSAAVSDLFRSERQYREERVLIAKSAPVAGSSAGYQAVADAVRLVPETAGEYQARALPSADDCLRLLESKLLGLHAGPAPASQSAPLVQLSSGETGATSDLETRIDQAPLEEPGPAQGATGLKRLLATTPILASLEVQSTDRDPGGVFVRIHSAVALVGATDWNEAEVQPSMAEFLSPNITASALGLSWRQKSGYQELDGLWPLAVSARGKYLVLADSSTMMEAMLANLDRAANAQPAALMAGFNHQLESANFARLTGVIDRNNSAQGFGASRGPEFFSADLASLSKVLDRVITERVSVRRDGSKELQTLTYELKE
jgi:hypothetical protein